jgi:hypothetical protein
LTDLISPALDGHVARFVSLLFGTFLDKYDCKYSISTAGIDGTGLLRVVGRFAIATIAFSILSTRVLNDYNKGLTQNRNEDPDLLSDEILQRNRDVSRSSADIASRDVPLRQSSSSSRFDQE